MFAPIVFVHPLRVKKLRYVTIAVCVIFFALAGVAILQDLRADAWVKAGFLAVAAYFFTLPLLRHSPWAEV